MKILMLSVICSCYLEENVKLHYKSKQIWGENWGHVDQFLDFLWISFLAVLCCVHVLVGKSDIQDFHAVGVGLSSCSTVVLDWICLILYSWSQPSSLSTEKDFRSDSRAKSAVFSY